MTAAYLYLNSALYALFAVWCTLASQSTSRNLGYETLSASGRSEYLVIYGGLQLGLAAAFYLFARNPQTIQLGLIFALCLYVPIVLYRIVTIAGFWPVAGLTLGVAALEIALLIAGLFLLYRR